MESTLHLFLRLIGGIEEGKHIEPPLYNFLKGYESSKEEEEDISRTASFGLFMPPSFRIGLYGKLLAKEEDKISRRPSFGDISNLYKGLLQEGKKISRLPSFESFLNLYKAPLQEEEKISRTLSFGYFSNRYKAPLQEEEEEAPQLSDISNLHEESLQEEKKISKALEEEDKRWSLHDEMSTLFNASLNRCFPEFEEEADLFPCYKTEHGDYNCQNVLTIWPKLTKSLELRDDHPHIKRPRDVGIAIKRILQDTALDMIEGQPSVFDVGFVTFSLSPKWMAERIHMMLKDGIDTWAPILPVERVLVKYPSLDEEIHTGLSRRSVIAETLVRMLSYSKVDATMTPTIEKDMLDSPLDILKRCFLIEERSGGDLVIGVDKDKPPFILAKKDLNRLYADLASLRYGFEKDKADWIVYVTPVRKQEYIEMCFTVAKLENWTPTVRKWKWIPDGTIYAGYRTCTETIGLDFLLRLNTRCLHVAEGEDVKSLGYTSFEVCRCVIRYRLLKTNRLANFTFTFDEMVGEEGNTFVYLLNTLAKIRKITNEYRKDIDELMKAPNLVSEKSERRGECEEHALELHLLEFTVALKESCSSLSPHIVCEYLYGLSKKFTNYYSSMGEVGSESTLLLCEATTIVMDKCFHILGLTPSDFMTQGLYLWHFRPYRSKDVKARDPPRNSRFELFSIRPHITTDPTFEKGKMFGFIAVSDKYGLLSDGVSHLFEPDFAYVPLFNHEWCHPINMHNGEYIYLGNPSSRHSVAFSSSIEISMEIYVTTEKNAFELYSGKFKLDLLNIWGKNLGNECRFIKVEGEDGFIEMYYMLIKDAVDAAVEIRYKTKRIADEDRDCKVHGQIYAYYGSDILNHCRSSMRPCYWALLFRSDVPFALEGDKIPLRKSVLAVPKGAPLKISAYLYDVVSGEVILDGICELDSLTKGSSKGDIQGLEGTECSLSLKVNWTYQA